MTSMTTMDPVGEGDGVCFLCMEDNCKVQCEFCPAQACSKDHMDIHRPADYCFPFRIRQRSEVKDIDKINMEGILKLIYY